MQLETALKKMPLIAILRGITPDQAVDTCAALVESGILAIETPLNSPRAVDSIERMAARYSSDAAIGAGTVLTTDEVRSVSGAGGVFTVAPNTDVTVIRAATDAGLTPMPGIATATEAFTALQSGASLLKLFPADCLGCGYLRALKAVLPNHAAVFAVGGVVERNLAEWIAVGAAGFGIGSSLYKPGDDVSAISRRAAAFVKQYQSIRTER